MALLPDRTQEAVVCLGPGRWGKAPTCCAMLGCKGMELFHIWNLALGWGTVLGYPCFAFRLHRLAPQLGLGKILQQSGAGMQAAGERICAAALCLLSSLCVPAPLPSAWLTSEY